MNLRKWLLILVLCGSLVGCNEPYSSGDRVLVSKCAYDNGFVGPHRYDVVVFKYPRGPVEKTTPKNYIKRLLGLPGELIAIFFGRVYHRVPGPDEAPFFDDLKDGTTKASNLWENTYLHRDDPKSRERFEAGEFTILRKPLPVMMALRRIVYDNDFQAKDLVGKLERWNPAPGSNWKRDGATDFSHAGKDDKQMDWLRYRHLLRSDLLHKAGKPMLILDTLDYNAFQPNPVVGLGDQEISLLKHIYGSAHWVGDLMIECNVEVVAAKGEFCFELSRGPDRFRACWDLAKGKCTLFRVSKNGVEQLGQADTSVKSPGNYMLRLANFDARLTVWVDRTLPFGDGKEYVPPELDGPKGNALKRDNCGPTLNDLEPASIGSKGASVKVSHLRVWRDVYYRTNVDPNSGVDHDGGMTPEDWSEPSRWEKIRNQRFVTRFVQPGHYFCLGDNSEASSDSRDWGTVPERLMLGRALVVYFPIDRIGPIR